MENRFNQWVLTTAAVLSGFCVVCTPTRAQDAASQSSPSATSPARARPKPTLTPPGGPTPRDADGHPDLSGVWFAGPYDPDHYAIGAEYHRPFDPKETPQEKPSFQSWAREKIKLMGNLEGAGDCSPTHGAPGLGTYPFELSQSHGQLIVLFEIGTTYRIIYTDGRPHLKVPEPQFSGDAIGRWDGDTLTVDVTGLDTNLQLGQGWFRSDVMHLVEHFSRPTENVMIYQYTIEDPKVLTKPWNSAPNRYSLGIKKRIYEYYCTNNQDAEQLEQLYGPKKRPVTADGTDERFFDEQEYEEMSKNYNK